MYLQQHSARKKRWSSSGNPPYKRLGMVGVMLMVLGTLMVAWGWLVFAELRMTGLKTRVDQLSDDGPLHTGSASIGVAPRSLLTRVEKGFENMEKVLASIHAKSSGNSNTQAYTHQLHSALISPSAHCAPHHGILYNGSLLTEQPGKQASAAECCAACGTHGPECSVWAWCGSKAKCGDSLHSCVLKRSANPTQPTVLFSGPDVPWVSGLVIAETQLEDMYAARGMSLVEAPTLLLGIRDGSATLSTISPRGEPGFSFSAPHDLPAMDRTGADFHHLGDVSIRLRAVPASDARHVNIRDNDSEQRAVYWPMSTVARTHWGAKLPPPNRATPIDTLPANTGGRGVKVFAHVNLAPQLPADSPVNITRWVEVPDVISPSSMDSASNQSSGAERIAPELLKQVGHSVLLDEEVRMYWRISHAGNTAGALELGSLALSMPFDQIFAERTLEKVAVQSSFVECYPGGQLGYIQVTKAHGGGPVLLILPAPDTQTSFEAWRPLQGDDASPLGFAFEGHHEVLLHSKAWAEKEWASAQPWVPPTSAVLQPGESMVVGIRLLLAAGPDKVEEALLAAGHPVPVGVPGFVIHADMESARLFVKHNPASLTLESVQVHPPDALTVDVSTRLGHPGQEPATHTAGTAVRAMSLKPTIALDGGVDASDLDDPSIWTSCGRYDMHDDQLGHGACPAYVGRARLQLRFQRVQFVEPRQPSTRRMGASLAARGVLQDVVQHVQVMVLPPARALVRQYGLTSARPGHGWLPQEAHDAWGRSPAFMGYDNEARRPVLSELRTYMAGLSDEAGAAQPLAMAIKQLGSPSRDQIFKLEEYVHETLYTPHGGDPKKHLQDHDTFAVRASMLYNTSDPELAAAMPAFIVQCHNTPPGWQVCWDQKRSMENWRAYNYPHVAAVYWTLYRLARVGSPPLATRDTWDWYLKQAVETMNAMWKLGKLYGRWGLMVGSVFRRIAEDVKLEGWTREQAIIDNIMKERLSYWQSLTFPFGSEMSWDNTGHEEIAAWLSAAGDREGEAATVRAVTAYMGLYPSWSLSGSARRWWDFFINGKLNQGNERVYHHYAAALNAMPLSEYYRKHPDNLFLLRLATAGAMGSLTNIMPDGGASMGWHGSPALLKPDGYSADYGIGFYGHWSQASGTLTCDESLGWLCFNCDIAALRPHSALLSNADAGICRQRPAVVIQLKDAFRRQIFVAPIGLLITVDNAWITGEVDIDFDEKRVGLTLSAHELRDNTAPGVKGWHELPQVVSTGVLTVEWTAATGNTATMVCGEGRHTTASGPGAAAPGQCAPAHARGPGAVMVGSSVPSNSSSTSHVIIAWQTAAASQSNANSQSASGNVQPYGDLPTHLDS